MTKKSSNRVFDTHKPDKIGGEALWRAIRERNVAQFRNKPGFESYFRRNTPNGMRKEEAIVAWAEARRLALIDMKNIKLLCPEINEIVEEATVAMLELMRSPMNQDMKLRAASQLLTFYKAKPQAPRVVTVDTAEEWLTAIGAEAATIEDNGSDTD